MDINVCSWYSAIHSCVLGKEAVFEHEKKKGENSFLQFLNFSWQIDASVNHVHCFSSVFAKNIRSRLFLANKEKCKPSFKEK